MTDSDTQARHECQERALLTEPDVGWSREVYDREIAAYVAQRGRGPQTATMHPETAATLGLREASAASAAQGRPLLVTSSAYARRTITLYY